jgi:hypothetical protein
MVRPALWQPYHLEFQGNDERRGHWVRFSVQRFMEMALFFRVEQNGFS